MQLKINPIFFGIVAFYCLAECSFLPLLIVFSAMMHELGHLLFMRYFRISVSSISLQPMGIRIDTGSAMMSYKQECLVALGGPAVNLCLAVPAFLFHAYFFGAVNLSLCLMNLLPAYPLDGGRALFSLLAPKHYDFAQIFRLSFSCFVCVGIMVLGVLLFLSDGIHFSLILIGLYLLISCISLERYEKT